MIEFKIENNEYKIEELTIGQYYKVQNLLVLEGVNAKIEIISHLSGCPTSELKKLDQYYFIQLWNAVAEGPLNTSENAPLQRNFLLNGKFYGFMDFSKMSIGEYSDMEVLKADPLSQSKLHIMMAVLYRPATSLTENLWVVKPYDAENVMERAEEFLDMPLKYVYGALHFFLRVQKILLSDMLDSLTSKITMEEMEKMSQEEKELTNIAIHCISELQEIGLTHSTWSREMILPNLEKLQALQQSLSLTTLPISKTSERKKRWNGKESNDKIKNKI